MKERPILMSAPMVRAILAGSKTQTRRVIKDQSIGERFCEMRPEGAYLEWLGSPCCGTGVWEVPEYSGVAKVPHGVVGDRLWIRETWAAPHDCDHLKPREVPPGTRLHYAADAPLGGLLGRPSIFMPRWASRITLEITEVRVERLQDISEADAQAEGCALECMTPTGDDSGSAIHGPGGYIALWESINGHGSWETNPHVWALSFKRIEETKT